MKVAALSFALLLLGLLSHAQTQKVTVYCEVHPSLDGVMIEYGDLGKFLPDSLKNTVLIDYKKQYRLRNANLLNTLLLMDTDGWKVVSVYYRTDVSTTTYMLVHDVYLDEAAHQLYVQKIKASFKPN